MNDNKMSTKTIFGSVNQRRENIKVGMEKFEKLQYTLDGLWPSDGWDGVRWDWPIISCDDTSGHSFSYHEYD